MMWKSESRHGEGRWEMREMSGKRTVGGKTEVTYRTAGNGLVVPEALLCSFALNIAAEAESQVVAIALIAGVSNTSTTSILSRISPVTPRRH